MRLALAIAAVLVLHGGSQSGAQTLGVFTDAAGTDCDATVPSFSITTLYVLARLGGPAADGITGVEFRIEGCPLAWFPTWTGPPSCDICTDPLRNGTNIAWPTCQSGTGGIVGIGTIQLIAFDVRPNVYIQLRHHATPSNPAFTCPAVWLCDAPVFTQVCAGSTDTILNGPVCAVAVEPRSWSQVKSLYD